jgi:hypothetical protein
MHLDDIVPLKCNGSFKAIMAFYAEIWFKLHILLYEFDKYKYNWLNKHIVVNWSMIW